MANVRMVTLSYLGVTDSVRRGMLPLPALVAFYLRASSNRAESVAEAATEREEEKYIEINMLDSNSPIAF